jgi:hypothetical protein
MQKRAKKVTFYKPLLFLVPLVQSSIVIWLVFIKDVPLNKLSFLFELDVFTFLYYAILLFFILLPFLDRVVLDPDADSISFIADNGLALQRVTLPLSQITNYTMSYGGNSSPSYNIVLHAKFAVVVCSHRRVTVNAIAQALHQANGLPLQQFTIFAKLKGYT